MNKPLKVFLIVIAAVLLATVIYCAYLLISYDRIEDNRELTPAGTASADAAQTDRTYTIATQNIGFGAYTADYTFFMDGGTQSWAKSPESVVECVDAAARTVGEFSPDFILFQEVDTDSTRSYHIDELKQLESAFGEYAYVPAENFHSSYLFYPFYQPHGASRSCIVTFSRITVTSALRRSLPISTGISKLVDLDRCYSVSRVPMENGRELVLYNVHLSAYGGSDDIRTAQMTMLLSDMKAEYDAGNYCICGGDFNHDFTGDSTQKLNSGENAEFGWAQPFLDNLLPQGIHRCTDYSDGLLPTCRNCDIPYVEGNFTVVVDGFLVSDNVTVTELRNVQTGFSYSDHSPVVMQFSLNAK